MIRGILLVHFMYLAVFSTISLQVFFSRHLGLRIFLSYGPGLTSMQHTTSHTTAVHKLQNSIYSMPQKEYELAIFELLNLTDLTD